MSELLTHINVQMPSAIRYGGSVSFYRDFVGKRKSISVALFIHRHQVANVRPGRSRIVRVLVLRTDPANEGAKGILSSVRHSSDPGSPWTFLTPGPSCNYYSWTVILDG